MHILASLTGEFGKMKDLEKDGVKIIERFEIFTMDPNEQLKKRMF